MLKEILYSPLNRCSDVYRYSNVYQETRESLSDHIVEIQLICMNISQKLVDDIDEGLMLAKCLYHDIDEVFTGDIPRNTKYFNKTTKKSIDEVASASVCYHVDRHVFQDYWNSSKEGKEGFIIKLADMLCVVRKCSTEVVLRGNKSFLKVVIELRNHLRDLYKSFDSNNLGFSDSSLKVLKTIVKEAQDSTDSLIDQYRDIIKYFNLEDSVIVSNS